MWRVSRTYTRSGSCTTFSSISTGTTCSASRSSPFTATEDSGFGDCADAARSAADEWLQTRPSTSRPFMKFGVLLKWRGCSTSTAERSLLWRFRPAPSSPHNSTSSASGVTNGVSTLFFTLRPVQVMITLSPAATTASSSERRCSRRASESPMSDCLDSRSSPSMSPVPNTPSSSPTRHTTRNGTERSGIMDVAVMAPVRRGWRPGAAVSSSVTSEPMCAKSTGTSTDTAPLADGIDDDERNLCTACSASSISPSSPFTS